MQPIAMAPGTEALYTAFVTGKGMFFFDSHCLCLWIQSRTPGVEEFAVDYAGAALGPL